MTVAVSLLLLSLFPFVLVIEAEGEESHTWQVSTGLDDAGGEISGGWWLTAVGPLYSDNQVDRLFYTGQRFAGINITSGSTITSASLIMTSRFDYAVNDTRQMRVQAEDADNASQFSNWDNFVGRSKTFASVLWNFTDDPYVNSSHLSPDLKDVIQEVIDREDWRSGNALAIFTSQTFWQQWDLRFWHYDGAPDKAPKLTITWTEGARAPSDYILIDNYNESNRDGWATINGNHPSGAGDWARSAFYQSFQNLNGTHKITSVKFYLRKVGSPTGTSYVKLYAHDGTYGTSSVPTGDPLATSDGFDISTLTGDYQLITFNFSGEQQYQMSPNSYYCIQLEAPSDGTVDTSNFIRVSQDESTPTHGGNVGYWRNNGWIVISSHDGYFYVYGDAVSNTGMG